MGIVARRVGAAGLTVVVSAALLAGIAPAVAAAESGPSVPLPPVPSVPVESQQMGSRPADQATTSALKGDQPSAAAPDGGGTSTATSLAPSATWDVAEYTGDFSWSYPLRVPPAAGGLEPDLALSYRSSAVDGRTSATNNQASWVGDGWDVWPGYIERSYGACADDTEGGTTPPRAGDLCWRSDNAVASYSGAGGMLIRDDRTGEWRSKNDDGSRIERIVGGAGHGNGDADGEYWRITSVDGTQYLFGRNHGVGGASAATETNSVWTVPVYANHAGEPGQLRNEVLYCRREHVSSG